VCRGSQRGGEYQGMEDAVHEVRESGERPSSASTRRASQPFACMSVRILGWRYWSLAKRSWHYCR
jgi:hypothetical protein